MPDLNQSTLNNAYARWAPVYDRVFGKVFDVGRSSSIEAAEKIGGRILDVGIGTGISLEKFSRANKISGVDISQPMLQKALERVVNLGLSNVETIAVMDAARLGFPDNFFDVVVAQYVVTAVPDPDAAMNEFIRVCKPGGEVIVVNHLGAEGGPRRVFEICFKPIAKRLGWRPEFKWKWFEDYVKRHGGVRLIERRPMPPMGHFAMIRFQKL